MSYKFRKATVNEVKELQKVAESVRCLHIKRLYTTSADIHVFRAGVEVLESYYTPIIVNYNGVWYFSTLSYSMTTWQHIHKYARHEGTYLSDAQLVQLTRKEFNALISALGFLSSGWHGEDKADRYIGLSKQFYEVK